MKHPNVERQPSGDQGRPLSSRPTSSSRRDQQKPNTPQTTSRVWDENDRQGKDTDLCERPDGSFLHGAKVR